MEMGAIVAHSFKPAGDVVQSKIPGGRTAHYFMDGTYDGLPAAWQTLFDWCAKEGLTPAGVNWEIYSDIPKKPSVDLYVCLK